MRRIYFSRPLSGSFQISCGSRTVPSARSSDWRRKRNSSSSLPFFPICLLASRPKRISRPAAWRPARHADRPADDGRRWGMALGSGLLPRRWGARLLRGRRQLVSATPDARRPRPAKAGPLSFGGCQRGARESEGSVMRGTGSGWVPVLLLTRLLVAAAGCALGVLVVGPCVARHLPEGVCQSARPSKKPMPPVITAPSCADARTTPDLGSGGRRRRSLPTCRQGRGLAPGAGSRARLVGSGRGEGRLVRR